MKNITPKYRKIYHYILLVCILILQIFVVIIWHNQATNDDEISGTLNDLSFSNKIAKFTNRMNNFFVNSQENFNDYIEDGSDVSLNEYYASLGEMDCLLDSLNLVNEHNEDFKNILTENNEEKHNVLALDSIVNTILEKQINFKREEVSNLFKFNKFEFNSILNSIDIVYEEQIDSVAHKGVFARIGNAIAGKIETQKERIKVTVTMKYKDEVSSGSIEKQMADLFLTTNNYYKNEFKNLKHSFLGLRAKNLKIIALNNQFFNLSQKVLSNYNSTLNVLQDNNQKSLLKEFKSIKVAKNYVIIVLILLMIAISIVLVNFTRMAFQYEAQLIKAKNRITQNLNFKSRIMDMLSHDVRSPLKIISIYSNKISKAVNDINIVKSFKGIEYTANSLLLLTNQILEFSKDEKKKLQLKKHKINLKTEIDQIITSMALLVDNRGNKILVNSNLNEDLEMAVDMSKIHQLFHNIVGNANKFTENGLITITVNLIPCSNSKMNLKVDIQDNGMGICESDLKHIFESYYQGVVSEKVNNLGIGLGLNLCKEIVELFNGHINIQSTEGEGTTVSFNLIMDII